MEIKRTIEETIGLPEGVNLEGLPIQKGLYDLVVKNSGERLELQFHKRGEGKLDGNSPEFAIRIHEDGISFERYVHRPEHDHDDTEYLVIANETSSVVRGKIKWAKEFPFENREYVLFRVPFGSVTVSY